MTANPSPLTVAYFGFLQRNRDLKAYDGILLSPNERLLFESIVLAWHKGTPMSVGDATIQQELGSAATLHKRLVQLRMIGLIEVLQPAVGKRRTKLLVPTDYALLYFEQLGKALMLKEIGKESK